MTTLPILKENIVHALDELPPESLTLLAEFVAFLQSKAVLQSKADQLSKQEPSAQSPFGAFPELAALTEDDFQWGKKLWEGGLENQMRQLETKGHA